MNRLHQFERLIDHKLRGLFRGPAGEGERRELIEVHRAILDEIASRTELLPRGRRVFPYGHVNVRVLVPDPGRRRSTELVFVEGGTLARDVRGRLEEVQAEIPDKFRVDVELVDELPADIAARGFDVSYKDTSPSETLAKAQVPKVTLTVVQGKAERDEFAVTKRHINLGRLTDVLDASQRIVRRNDVAFTDSNDPPNPTVSRAHAHLEFDPETASFRLFDDRSALGTSVLHNGEIVPVPRGSSRGVPVQTGDEILLGQARLRFEVADE